jgi:hypothetical protein
MDVRRSDCFAHQGMVAGSVDLVSIYYLLHHLTEGETSALLQQVHAVLAPGGTVAVAALLDQVTLPTTTAIISGGGTGTVVGVGGVDGSGAGAPATGDTIGGGAALTAPKTTPLAAVLQGMYKSFARVETLLAQLAAAGFTTVPAADNSIRPPIYPNEFPCDRCCILATKGVVV